MRFFSIRYFEDDEDVNPDDLEYQPAPGSPTLDPHRQNEESSDSEEDPLDAFMAGIEVSMINRTERISMKMMIQPHIFVCDIILFANITETGDQPGKRKEGGQEVSKYRKSIYRFLQCKISIGG